MVTLLLRHLASCTTLLATQLVFQCENSPLSPGFLQRFKWDKVWSLKASLAAKISHGIINNSCMTGWWFGTWILFFHILGIVFPTEFHIFQRGRYTTNQMIMSVWWYLLDRFIRSALWPHWNDCEWRCNYPKWPWFQVYGVSKLHDFWTQQAIWWGNQAVRSEWSITTYTLTGYIYGLYIGQDINHLEFMGCQVQKLQLTAEPSNQDEAIQPAALAIFRSISVLGC